mgnify:FL=1
MLSKGRVRFMQRKVLFAYLDGSIFYSYCCDYWFWVYFGAAHVKKLEG